MQSRARALVLVLRRRQHGPSRSSRAGGAAARVSNSSFSSSTRAAATTANASSSSVPTTATASATTASASASASSSEVAGASALQQQLSFCCLLCGWETACTACPFDWYGFDPRKFRSSSRQRQGAGAGGRRGGAAPGVRASATELHDALATLGIAATGADAAASVSVAHVKAAFRAKALEWHPDCSKRADAEETFKGIVRAYELLLGALSPPSSSSSSSSSSPAASGSPS